MCCIDCADLTTSTKGSLVAMASMVESLDMWRLLTHCIYVDLVFAVD